MIDARESRQTETSGVMPRRRFLGRLGTLVGGLLAALGALGPFGELARALARAEPETPRGVPRERPLAEADLYRPHDLAG